MKPNVLPFLCLSISWIKTYHCSSLSLCIHQWNRGLTWYIPKPSLSIHRPLSLHLWLADFCCATLVLVVQEMKVEEPLKVLLRNLYDTFSKWLYLVYLPLCQFGFVEIPELQNRHSCQQYHHFGSFKPWRRHVTEEEKAVQSCCIIM